MIEEAVVLNEARRAYDSNFKRELGYYKDDGKDDTPAPLRRRALKRVTKLEEKIDIAHEAIIDREQYKDVAAEHRVSKQAVMFIVRRLRQDPKMFQRQRELQQRKEQTRMLIKDFLTELMNKVKFIDSAHVIQKKLKEQTGVEVELKIIREVMSKDL